MREIRLLRPKILSLYKKCLQISMQFEGQHKYIWRDYTRLKFNQNRNIRDTNQINTLILQALDEIKWVEYILTNKSKGK